LDDHKEQKNMFKTFWCNFAILATVRTPLRLKLEKFPKPGTGEFEKQWLWAPDTDFLTTEMDLINELKPVLEKFATDFAAGTPPSDMARFW
jgi:hypothetical protein